jgi:transposase
MKELTTVGLDLAKQVVQVYGEGTSGEVLVRKSLRAERVVEFFANRPPCVVAMEACAGAHALARRLADLGHEVRIIAAQFVKAFRLGGKNDGNDAQAICVAARQPHMRFVRIKTEAQQAVLAMHTLRDGQMKMRTEVINRLRGLLMEFGLSFAQSPAAAIKGARLALADERLSALVREAVADCLDQVRDLDERIARWDWQIAQHVREEARASRLRDTLCGVGPLTASAFAASVPCALDFKNGRQFAAWLGLTPKQHSTGGKTRLGGLSKQGNGYLRTLLIQGSRSALQAAQRAKAHDLTRLQRWILDVYARRGYHKTLAAIANKQARLIWVLLTSDGPLRAHERVVQA